MAISGIPTPMNGMDAFIKGFGFDDNLIKQIQARKELEEKKQQFSQELALKKQAASRAGQFDPMKRMILEQQLLKLKHSNDPMYEFQQFQNLMKAFSGEQSPQENTSQEQSPPMKSFGEGQGMFNPESMQGASPQSPSIPQQPQSKNGGMNLDALKSNPMLRGFFKHKYGFDPLASSPETPEQKRNADLQSKIELENIKAENKDKALVHKEELAAKKDLPTLEKSLKGVNELMRIAKDNPDMFGHGFMPDRFAKTTKIKDFGKWQNLISDAIAGLEQKLSSRGNIVALKMAAQLKPSHAEQQEVAIGKLESMKQQLEDAISNSKGGKGKSTQSSSNNMDFSHLSDEELQRIASGGQ